MRRNEREFALKILFACEFGDKSWETHKTLLGKKELEYETEFSKGIIYKYFDCKDEIDKDLKKHIKNWEYNRVATIDKIILRISIIEFLYFPEIPPEATINEAIELAKIYSTPQSGTFVNGILDSVFKEMKNDIKNLKKGRGKVSKILNSK